MKKIFKLFPVALAAVALASCSSDDLTALNGEDQLEINPNYLYVTVENDNPITRAAYVSANVQAKEQASGNDFFRALYWTKGDKIKLYSEMNNWRTQEWEYDPETTGALPAQYKKENGFSVFQKCNRRSEHNGTPDDQYTDGYGVMPADLSEFTNEQRTKLTFNLESLRYTQFTQDHLAKTASASETAEDAADLYYGFGALNVYKSTAPLPLWGVATQNQMKCKWLTGHLCVDVTNFQTNIIPANDDVNKNYYLVIQSDAKSLWGTFEAVDFDPDMINVAPVLTAKAATATTITSGVTKIEELGEDCIVLNLGQCAEGLKRIIAYAPIMCDATTPTHVIAKLYTGTAATTYETAKATVLNEVTDWQYDMVSETIEAGKLYRIANLDARTIKTANTPYSLQQQLASIDAEMERDYVVTIENDVLVKTAATKFDKMSSSVADPHNYVLDLSAIDFKHNVEIRFDGIHGFTNNEVNNATDINYLYIKTKQNTKGKKIVLDLGNRGDYNIRAIVVDNELKGDLILKGAALSDGTNPTYVANFATATAEGASKLTIAAGATKVYTKGAINIDAKYATIANLVALNNGTGNYTVSLNNGTITDVTVSNAKPTDKGDISLLDAAGVAVANDVTISSTGLSAITNTPVLTGFATCGVGTHTKHYQNGLYFKSKWDGESKWGDEAAASITGGNIYTAAQLASVTGSGASDYTLCGDIDLNNKAWTTVATLTKNFKGADKKANVFVTPGATTCKNDNAAYPTIEKLTAPLFGTATLAANGYIKNFKLKTVAFEASYAAQGALARTVTATGNCTIDNVDAESVTITAAGKSAIGGLVGLLTSTDAANTVDVINCNLDGVNLKGNRQMGGIIGSVATSATSPKLSVGATNTAINTAGFKVANAAFCTAANINFELTETPLVIYDPEYASLGVFVGQFNKSDAASFNMVVNTVALPTFNAPTGTAADNGANLFSARAKYGVSVAGKTIYYDVVMGQQLTGYADKSNSPKATIFAVSSADATKFSKTVYSAYATTPDPVPAAYLYYVAE